MIPIKTKREIATMREGGKILQEVVEKILALAKPGITTQALETEAARLLLERGAEPAFPKLAGFPGVIHTAINEEVVHIAPSDHSLQEGEILSIDAGLLWYGYYLDMARTIAIGNASDEVRHFLKTAKKSLRMALRNIKPGNTVGDIGNVIERFVESQGYAVIRELCGHGIGKELHEDPQIPNTGTRNSGEKLLPGMVMCVEPMITMGSWEVIRRKGGGYVTKDGSLSAHVEDTILVTPQGCEVLTTTSQEA
ncbi:MAG: type I methionyl aminopeptidase [bacterium]|nr:type I methionyl aminopeptidase [bacterium]